MRALSRAIAGALVAALLSGAAAPARAAEGAVSTVFNDAWYGGLTGALIGAAVLVFVDDPEDHLAYIAYGAAGGVLAGAAIGMVDSTRSLAEVRDGRVALALPTVTPEVRRDPGGAPALGVRADLVRMRF